MVADMWQSTSRQRCSCCLPAPFGACPFALDLTSSIECLHSHCIALYYNNKYNRFGSSCCTQLSCVPCYATSHLLQLPQSPVPAHPSLQASMHGTQHTPHHRHCKLCSSLATHSHSPSLCYHHRCGLLPMASTHGCWTSQRRH